MLAIVAVLAVGLLGLAVFAAVRPAPPSFEEQVRAFTDALDSDGPYREPSPAERDAVLAAVRHWDTAALGAAGFTVGTARTANGRMYHVAGSDPATPRAWGLIAMPVDVAPTLLIEVPHPNSDLDTQDVGLAVLAARPDAIYLQAGAHRKAGGDRADVAHEEGSLFHALAVDLSTRLRLPQLQLHGFGDRDDVDADIVLGGGPEDPQPSVADLADRLDGAVSVCRAWRERCAGLEGRTNVQGRAAHEAALPFAHVEMNATLRRNPARVAPLLATLR